MSLNMDEKVYFNADMESCLFYAMMDHKPVGKNDQRKTDWLYVLSDESVNSVY